MANSQKPNEPRKLTGSLWKRLDAGGDSDITVPVHLAYCGIVAALRHQVRARTSSLAILEVETPDALDSYIQAGRLFLRQRLDRQGYEGPFVGAIRQQKKDRPTEFEVYRRAAEAGTGILLCTDLRDVDDEMVLFADVVTKVSKPSRRQIKATFRRFGHVATETELDIVAEAPWKRLVYAFLPERPVLCAVRRLRATADRPPAGNVQPVSEDPSLSDLHGFGEAQVWGLELARDLRDFTGGLIEWDEVDSGLLVSGAPGTGKTFFAKALAKTCGVPIVVASAAQWQASGYLNDFLKMMTSTFLEAQSKAPSILFIDEVDSFGSRAINDSQHGDYKRQVINGLLEQLDGFQRRTGVVVIGATNHPENLDPAITRPGRLDKHIVIPLPDAPARRLIFEQCSGLEVPDSVMTMFARSTAGMSGASIKQVVRNAKRAARRADAELTMDHVLAVTRPMATVPAETLRIVAVHETGHAIVGTILGLPLEGITIADTVVTDGTSMMGGALFGNPLFAIRNKEFHLNQLRMLLGGIAAETLMFAGFENGVIDSGSDLARATALATKIEACLGLGDTLAVEVVQDHDLSRLRSSDPELRQAVRKLLQETFENAVSILSENINSLHVISDTLERQRYLSSSVVRAILRGHHSKTHDRLG